MPPAARITDMHACPVPTHVGGPVVVGEPTVLIGYMPAARVGDQLICATGPDVVSQGENTVLIGSSPAARLGDPTAHGGKIVVGCPTVIIGSQAQVSTLRTDKPFCEECERKRRKREAEAKDQMGVQTVSHANVGTGLHLGPGATQAKPAVKVAPVVQPKPCDFDVVEVLCKHCGAAREIAGVKFNLDAQGKQVSNHVRSPNAKRPFLPDRFEVVGSDEVTVKVTGGPGHHDGTHPTITLTPPSQAGAPEVVRGQATHKFKVAFTAGWFQSRLKGATSLGFVAALKQFFYPEPLAYGLRVAACGVRPGGHPFQQLDHTIRVYAPDIFKVALQLPSAKKVERVAFAGTEGKALALDYTKTTTKGFPGSTSTQGHEVRIGGPGPLHKGTNEDKAGDSAVKATAKSITITRDGEDVTGSFKIAEFIDFIADLRAKIMDVVDFVKAIANKSPKIGWSLSFSLEFFSGSLEYSWGYQEWAKDHTVYRYWKLEAALTVISCKLELAFGVSLLKAEAKVYGALSGDLKITASKEANPDKVGLAASVAAALTPGGEIGVRGALGDWVEVVGKINAGFEGSTKIDLSPFKWTVKIDLSEGKGTFVIKSKLGLSYETKKTLWDKKPILTERTIIG